MKILNIINHNKPLMTKIVEFQEKFELQVPIWTQYITIDELSGKIEITCWEHKPFFDNELKGYCQNESYYESEYLILKQYEIVIDGDFEPICEKVKKIYEVRREVFNMVFDMWNTTFDKDWRSYRGTVEYFLKNIGLPSALTAKCNEEETEFFDEIYKLQRGN